MMKKISDERLEKMLTTYCEAATEQTFTFDPEKKSEKLVPFLRFRKQLIAAASLVLVSVLSLIIYFSFGNINNTPLTVAPSRHKIITPSSTEGGGGGDPDQQDGASQNGSKSLLQRIHDFFFPDDSAESGSSSSERGGASSSSSLAEKGGLRSGRTSRHDPPTSPGATHPSGTSSEIRSDPTESDDPTPIIDIPTEPDTPPYVPPTVPIDPPSAEPVPTEPPYDGEPGCIEPTEGGVMTRPPVEVMARIDSERMEGVTAVYCKVYSEYGFIGSEDLYDCSHQAEILDTSSQYTEVLYETPDGLIFRPGFYIFVFYDQNGNELAQWQDYCG